ncbi:MAG: NUDIX hydrolase [Candidatus Poribacteria bacterium]|nr:NUDIX hydrolase [Candidatus Poribacteria bacterium]
MRRPHALVHQYPDLFRPADWRVVNVEYFMCDELPDDALIANANLVPRVGNDYLIIRHSNGEWSIPGGTREPNEPLIDALARELHEEAGAELLNATFFGVWKCVSSQPEPYRPHIPHPMFYRAVGVGDARVVGQPRPVADGEEIDAVAVVPLDEAVRRLRSTGRNDLADLYRLGADMARRIDG